MSRGTTMRGRGLVAVVCLAALLLAGVVGCSRSADLAKSTAVHLRSDGSGSLPADVVVVRVEGPIENRHAPEQWIVDRLLQILPGSKSATVNFAGLADGRIVEADCAEQHSWLGTDDCGETGFASSGVLDLLRLGKVDSTIQERTSVAFDPGAVDAGRVRIRTGNVTMDLPAVHGTTTYKWLGLPTVWIPNLQPGNGLVPLPFATVVASPAPLSEPQYAAIDALQAEVAAVETRAVLSPQDLERAGCADDGDPQPVPPVSANPTAPGEDICKEVRAIARLGTGRTDLYTARSI